MRNKQFQRQPITSEWNDRPISLDNQSKTSIVSIINQSEVLFQRFFLPNENNLSRDFLQLNILKVFLVKHWQMKWKKKTSSRELSKMVWSHLANCIISKVFTSTNQKPPSLTSTNQKPPSLTSTNHRWRRSSSKT